MTTAGGEFPRRSSAARGTKGNAYDSLRSPHLSRLQRTYRPPSPRRSTLRACVPQCDRLAPSPHAGRSWTPRARARRVPRVAHALRPRTRRCWWQRRAAPRRRALSGKVKVRATPLVSTSGVARDSLPASDRLAARSRAARRTTHACTGPSSRDGSGPARESAIAPAY
jgi:hypothetical protein